MSKIPERNSTIDIIDDTVLEEKPRPYLGMSGIGNSCNRQLWYGFHFASLRDPFTARTRRIFSVGHLFEEIAIRDLKMIGAKVFRVDEDGKTIDLTGKYGEIQEEFVGFLGHVKGHPDGRIVGLLENVKKEYALELKTMKDDKFKAFVKFGIEKSNYVYYCQSQRYMFEMGLNVCFFLACNKNDSSYHYEFIVLDRTLVNDLIRKEKYIVISDSPPDRAYASNHYLCGWCDHYMHCHAKSEPDKNCRTCDFSDIGDNGEWFCNNNKHIEIATDGKCEDEFTLTLDDQIAGCEFWKKGWEL